jgi:hypothetical protein
MCQRAPNRIGERGLTVLTEWMISSRNSHVATAGYLSTSAPVRPSRAPSVAMIALDVTPLPYAYWYTQ